MKVYRKIEEIREQIKKDKLLGKKIGFVPTMGFLHKGHKSLLEIAKEKSDVLVLSIFVNPIQFGPEEDLDKYPRDFIQDEKIAKDVGVDYIFYPEEKEMYPNGISTFVNVENLTDFLCGKKRIGHFRGVTTIVTKLFNIIQPDIAVFGKKDAQQLRVIEKMVEDLNIDTKIFRGEIVREDDGLALSSRNKYLTNHQRKNAIALKMSLEKANEMIKNGETNVLLIKNEMKNYIEKNYEGIIIDYLEIVNFENLESQEEIRGEILIAGAIFLGKTRLIDNMILKID